MLDALPYNGLSSASYVSVPPKFEFKPPDRLYTHALTNSGFELDLFAYSYRNIICSFISLSRVHIDLYYPILR